jgi:uncharacterized protein YjbI with pentapeptide repeats
MVTDVAKWTIEITALLVAGVALKLALDANDMSLRSLKQSELSLADQRESSAWQILTMPAAGSAGKKYALSILLARSGARLSDIDVSCEGLGSSYGELGRCRRPPDLSEIVIDSGSFSIDGSDFSGADLYKSMFVGGMFYDVKFDWADLSNSTFSGGRFDFISARRTSLNGAYLSGIRVGIADFTEADLRNADFLGSTFGLINVSGAGICAGVGDCPKGLGAEFLAAAWYFDDNPPIGLENILGDQSLVRKCPGAEPAKATLNIRMAGCTAVWKALDDPAISGGRLPNFYE